MKVNINGSGVLLSADLEAQIAHMAQAAADGFERYWLAQVGLTDALTVFSAAAGRVPDIEMGTAVIPTFNRHPSALAAQALTAQALTGGRINLGIGLSHKPTVEENWGMRFERPIRHLIDYLEILGALMTEGRVDYHGEVFTCVSEATRPTEDPPSLLVAALGPQALKVAGSRTDGTILWMVGPNTIADHVAPRIREAAAGAGRPEPRIVCSLPVLVTDDASGAREFADVMLENYGTLPSYRAMLDREGAEGPGDVCVFGTEQQVLDHLGRIAEAGATEFTAVEFGVDPEAVARTREVLKAYNA